MIRSIAIAVFVFLSNSNIAQYTYVPDDDFEMLIESTIPGAFNGVVNDDSVNTAAIETVVYLHVLGSWHPVHDLTGIEAFTSLDSLIVELAPIDSIDLSNYLPLATPQGFFLLLNVTAKSIILPPVNVSRLYISQNNALETVSFTPGFNLAQGAHSSFCYITYNPLLAALDFSGTPFLDDLDVEILANNNLESLNISNGYNNMIMDILIMGNQNLFCVEVDDPIFSENNSNWTWYEKQYWLPTSPNDTINPYNYTFAGYCAVAGINELSGYQHIELLKITDILGKEVDPRFIKNGEVVLYLYSNGMVEKKVHFSN